MTLPIKLIKLSNGDSLVAKIYVNEDNKISGMANGKFWNPYRNEMQIGLLIFENIKIGTDT